MATSANLSSIIRFYAEKQKSPFIDLREFCAYVKKYAEHHVEEQSDLVKYLGDPTNTITAELQGLSEKHLVSVLTNGPKKTIVSISFFANLYVNQYKEIVKNEATPYPLVTDLPKQFPTHALEKKLADKYIISLIDKPAQNLPFLYILEFTREIPSLLIPACIPIKTLIETSQMKIRKILKKEEHHDYILKKLRSTNPTKEISIKNFFSHFVDSNNPQFEDFSQGDDYYIWNQTLYYIRQDFEKIQDKTSEDINILQAAQISEIHCTYLKEKFQNDRRREEALKELEGALSKQPFFYTMNQILAFKDQNGKTLLGKYSEEDLKEFMQKSTTEGDANELPPLLVFKVESGTKYFIYKKKVIQVIVRLCNEAHESIASYIEEKWFKSLLDYEKTNEMTDEMAFETMLHSLVKKESPILSAILNASFINSLSYEHDDDETMQGMLIFDNGELVSYSELLLLDRQKLYTNAKAKLPFIYTVPILSWILNLINSNKKKKKKSSVSKSEETSSIESILQNDEPEEKKKSGTTKTVNKQEALAAQAKEITKELIPEGSTIDRELNYLERQWNRLITKQANMQLTEDVNALIRDYTRNVVKTLSATTFTRERVENLAKTLCRTPNMQKISESNALLEYVTLYILRLVSNS